MRRSIALLPLVVLAVLLSAAPAMAHGDIESSDPEQGARIKKPTDHILINFTEAPTEDASIRVIDGCGRDIVSETYITDRTLHVLLDEGRPGQWQVAYRVISAEDGHKSNGTYGFRVKGRPDCSGGESEEPEATIAPGDDGDEAAAPDTDPTSDSGGSLPLVAIAIGGLALIGIAALVRMRSGS